MKSSAPWGPIEKKLLELALKEDIGSGDITTYALFSKKDPKARALLLAKEAFILAGLGMAQAVFKKVNPKIQFKPLKKEGSQCEEGDEIAQILSPASSLLSAERTALNFLQHLSGIATQTFLFVQSIQGTSAKILDTRKTLPAWRSLEKYAVKMGGGLNHRMGLDDAYLIKDNHLALYGSITKAIEAVRKHHQKKKKIEVEVTNLKEFDEALQAKPDWILLDNMGLDDMRMAVIQNRGRAILEASGNINLHNVRSVAQTGVDFISIGALTHSAPAVDISLEIL